MQRRYIKCLINAFYCRERSILQQSPVYETTDWCREVLRALRTGWLLVLLVLNVLPGCGQVATPTEPINSAPAIVFGTYPVSQYLLDKFHRRFVAAFQQQSGIPPDEKATRDWLVLFCSQQLVTAHAASLGYLTRPEVLQIVDRMERYMLTQNAGPLYQRLAASIPEPTPAQLKEFYHQSRLRLDLLVIRFPSPAIAESCIGKALLPDGLDGLEVQRLRDRANTCGAEWAEGVMPWPFSPFSEVSEELISLKPGQSKRLGFDWSEYYINVRSVGSDELGGSELIPSEFPKVVASIQFQNFCRKRRFQQLEAAHCNIDIDVAARLLALWSSLPSSAAQLPMIVDPDLAKSTALTYEREGVKYNVTADGYRAQFNARIIRRIPHSLSNLREDLEDIVANDFDLNEAKREGVDRDPRFVEDRRGFVGIQALDLFQKEVLALANPVTDQEVAHYYREHLAEFSRSRRIRGRLLSFTSSEKAIAWKVNPVAELIQKDESVELTTGFSRPGLELWQSVFMSSNVGQPIGPLVSGQATLMFIKQADLEQEAAPLSEVSGMISDRLLGERVQEKLRALAREISPKYPVQDQINYTQLGLLSADIPLPWRR